MPVLTKLPLEANIERDFVKKLRKTGWPIKLRKMNGLGNASWPDRLIVGPRSQVFWIEFKRPEIGKLSAGQEELFTEMQALGHEVHVFTDARLAILAVKYWLMNLGVNIDG